MRRVIYRNEEHFFDECPCAYQILYFVDSIKDTDARWFFDRAYSDYENEERHAVIFKSYITQEYKDYVLSVEAKKKNDGYDIRLLKKVDNLLGGNE